MCIRDRCATGTPGDAPLSTAPAGKSGLQFDGTEYTYVWKTDRSWAGTCRRLDLSLNDGSVYSATFRFRS